MTSVLVVDRSALFDGPWPHGFTAFQPDQAEKFLARIAQLAHLEPRPLAETTRAWKQLIPYCLLTCGDRAEGDLAAFAVQRTRGQSEGRLHGSWSLGIGGHIDELDVANCPLVIAWAARCSATPSCASCPRSWISVSRSCRLPTCSASSTTTPPT